jgi:hypothetical protein
MISRLFFRLRTWLILFIFLLLNISVPHTTEPDRNAIISTSIDGTTVVDSTESVLEVDCLLEVIIEESFALYDLFPSGEWATEETTKIPPVTIDIIMVEIVKTGFYPPSPRLIQPSNEFLPDDHFGDTRKRPPELNWNILTT